MFNSEVGIALALVTPSLFISLNDMLNIIYLYLFNIKICIVVKVIIWEKEWSSWSSGNGRGGAIGVAYFTVIDEQLQLNRGCCFPYAGRASWGLFFFSNYPNKISFHSVFIFFDLYANGIMFFCLNSPTKKFSK